jgi:hypothetical protein
MEKVSITTNERLQLIGLLTLAQHHERLLRGLEAAACEITGEEANSGGHTGDAIYSGAHADADDLLRKLGIRVEG